MSWLVLCSRDFIHDIFFMTTNYQEAVGYLESFIGKVIFNVKENPDPLARMRLFLKLLGNPEKKFSSVLVGGTSGKGSTATILSQILHTAGYKTGLTISPHLQSVTERIQLDCLPISEREFTLLLRDLEPVIEAMRKMPIGVPSYFEIVVAMAFVYFAQKKVDIAVAEVGMGGEFDATNTLSPLIAVLTNVSLDHTQILGNTVEEIARTKAGIIKSLKFKVKNYKLAVVSGVRQPSVVEIVKKRCEEKGALLKLFEKDFRIGIKSVTEQGSKFDFQNENIFFPDLFLSLPGEFQAENSALAIEAALNLRKFDFVISEESIRKALGAVSFAGRFEIFVSRDSVSKGAKVGHENFISSPRNAPIQIIVLDGAHNSAKMKAFLNSVKKLFPGKKKIFVAAFKNDKDIKKLLKQILKEADVLILTEFGGKTDVGLHTATSAEKLFEQAREMEKDVLLFAEKNSKKAMEKAFFQAKKMVNSLIIVTGSLYLVGEVREDLISNVDLT